MIGALLITIQLLFALVLSIFAVIALIDLLRSGSLPGMPSRGPCPDCKSFRFTHFGRCPHCRSAAPVEQEGYL